MSGFSAPAAPNNSPGIPGNFLPIMFAGFDGLNTQPTRAAIGNTQTYWCDNWVPFGKDNLVSMPGAGASLTLPNSGSGGLIQFEWFNINSTSY